jgi:hypothetical protein
MGNSLNSQPIESNIDVIEYLDEAVEMSCTAPSLDIQCAEILQLWENSTTGIMSSKKSIRKNDGDFYQVRWDDFKLHKLELHVTYAYLS